MMGMDIGKSISMILQTNQYPILYWRIFKENLIFQKNTFYKTEQILISKFILF